MFLVVDLENSDAIGKSFRCGNELYTLSEILKAQDIESKCQSIMFRITVYFLEGTILRQILSKVSK